MGKWRREQYKRLEYHAQMKDQTYENLKDFKKIMKQLDIQFCVTGGFLIGVYRDGDLPRNDEHDIDVKIWFNNTNKFFVPLFTESS